MTNLSASDLTKLTSLIDGQPRGRLATTAKTVERLRKTLTEAIGNPLADTVIDRAMLFETYGAAEAVVKAALKVGAGIAAEPASVAAPVETDGMGAAECTAVAKNADAKRRRTSAVIASQAAATGQMPTPPDFSAATHARFRGKLEGLIALAERSDIEGLRAVAINPVSSSPKALARYRDLCIAALEARKEA